MSADDLLAKLRDIALTCSDPDTTEALDAIVEAGSAPCSVEPLRIAGVLAISRDTTDTAGTTLRIHMRQRPTDEQLRDLFACMQPAALTEGCTPSDARALRDANIALAQELHELKTDAGPFSAAELEKEPDEYCRRITALARGVAAAYKNQWGGPAYLPSFDQDGQVRNFDPHGWVICAMQVYAEDLLKSYGIDLYESSPHAIRAIREKHAANAADELRTARGAIRELERQVFALQQQRDVLQTCLEQHRRDLADPPGYVQDAVIKAAGLGAMHEELRVARATLAKHEACGGVMLDALCKISLSGDDSTSSDTEKMAGAVNCARYAINTHRATFDGAGTAAA